MRDGGGPEAAEREVTREAMRDADVMGEATERLHRRQADQILFGPMAGFDGGRRRYDRRRLLSVRRRRAHHGREQTDGGYANGDPRRRGHGDAATAASTMPAAAARRRSQTGGNRTFHPADCLPSGKTLTARVRRFALCPSRFDPSPSPFDL
jgi:hypothetical protein